MLQMFATTGMRLAELVALRLDDLNWADGIIRIRLGKGQKERWVPFATKAQRAVYRYLKGRRQNGPHPELWISTHGGSPLSYSAVATEMQRLFRSAGLGLHDRCHIFRRTWAAGTVRQGIPRQYAQVAAGWTTTRMLDHYTAAMMDDEEAIEALRDFDPFAPRRTDF